MKLLTDDASMKTLSHFDYYYKRDISVLESMIGITTGDDLMKLTLAAISRHESFNIEAWSDHKDPINEVMLILVELNLSNYAENIADMLEVGGEKVCQIILFRSVKQFNSR